MPSLRWTVESRDGTALHPRGHGHVHKAQYGRGDVEEAQVLDGPAAGVCRVVEHEDAVHRVDGVVGASVVLGEVEAAVADGPRGSPREVVEVDHEVRAIAKGLGVEFLGAEGAGVHRGPVWALYPGNLLDEPVADLFVAMPRNGPLRLATFDVQEDPGVVPAPTPGRRTGPVHGCPVQGDDPVRTLVKGQVAALHKPLVYAEGAGHGLGAVVGDDEEDGVGQKFPELAEAPVHEGVILLVDVAVGTLGDVARV